MSNPLTQMMVFPDGYIPAQRLRVVAEDIEKFWGPLAECAMHQKLGYRAKPDDPMMVTATSDADALREVADLLDKLSKGEFIVPATTAQEINKDA